MLAAHWKLPYVRHRLIRAAEPQERAERATRDALRRYELSTAAAIAIVSILAIAAFAALAALPSPSTADATPEAAVETLEWPSRELPREWRGARKAVQFEHMYRPGASFPSYDHMVRQAR